MLRLLFICFLLTSAGCARGLYDWGSYNNHLYNYYENPAAVNRFRASLEKHLTQVEAQGKRPAPGLYAELGTLYFQLGDNLTALRYYQKEYDTWPESQHMMAAMIKRINSLPQQDLRQNEVAND
ncbi:MAG: DUF4810 domain-containing protein [Pseudomonadales bacterium]|nr:DUF4810 domain-containing protein [Pseudomonadales bacterium]